MEKQILNEESYQRTRVKLIVVAILLVIVAGVLLCIRLKEVNEVKQTIPGLEVEIGKIEAEIEELDKKITKVKREKSEMAYNGKTHTEAYYEKEDELEGLNKEKYKLNTKKDEKEDELEDAEKYSLETHPETIPIIIFLVFIAFGITIMANRRKINAFAVQQSMPIAKETMEEMTPSVAKAAGKVAREVKKALTEEDNDENK